MSNLLSNAGFENGFTGALSDWEGWYLHPNEGVICVYQKKTANPPTGFFQDIPVSKFDSDGTYSFQMRLLSPTPGIKVSPTVWVFKNNAEPQPTQQTFDLKVGVWQNIQLDVKISRSNLKKVRAELYFEPDGSEIIIQRTFFGKI